MNTKLPVIVVCLSLFTFSSCIFTPQKGSNPTTKLNYSGVITLRDIQGDGYLAMANASFEKTDTVRSSRLLLRAPETGAPDCEVRKQSFDTTEPAESVPMYVNVGQINFGTKLQIAAGETASLVNLKRAENNSYSAALKPGLSAGEYIFRAMTDAGVATFSESLYLPETIDAVKGNGLEIEKGLFVKKEEGFEIEWKKPTILSGLNILQLIYTAQVQIDETKFENHYIVCLARESQFATDPDQTTLKWEVPAKLVDQLPVTKAAMLQFSRILVAGAAKVDAQMQGFRTILTPSRLDPAVGE